MADSPPLKTNNMKLYTEEQVRKMLLQDDIFDIDDILDSQKPIELPLWEDIEVRALQYSTWNDLRKSFFNGALWMKEYIIKHNR